MILIGQAKQRRTRLLQAALHARGLPPATVIDWAELLRNPAAVAERLRAAAAAPVKLDSPGESTALEHALIREGWQRLGQPGPPPQPLAHGELAHRHWWYAGFAEALRRLEDAAPDRAMAGRWLNAPRDILRMCDKRDAQERLIAAGIATPPLLGPIDGYAQLRERMRAEGVDRVFVKPRYGSSAAGVVAYRCHRDGREAAYSSAEWVRDARGARLFNSLRPRCYTRSDEIAGLIDTLAVQSAYAEVWIAKPRAPGGAHFDLRVVAFAGRARQRVARIAAQPMTNLHLGNRRGAVETLLDPAVVARIEDAVARAAQVFPQSGSIGFDLIPGHRCVRVLEANAFGDLLPGLGWQGLETYDDQAAWCAAFAQGTQPQLRDHGALPQRQKATNDA